ncbi:hypothetical protein HII31_12078 [Pseudocercospora fuligena]|uniref:Uncharacterized protein n=1 Tax=Pseudocercospora fuligena TaxID=685502 RepID=A0A8H6VCS6_9PEZI|nr:hypothetical protein HII31_12078 [Pseudocercospora fuligena]
MSDATTKKPPKKKQIDFIVTTSDPNDASNAANKKRVRSVAALKSWPERRKKIFEQLESSGSGQGAFLVDEPGQQQQPKRRSPGQAKQPSPPTNTAANNGSTSVAKRPRVYGPPRPESAAGPSSQSTATPATSTLNPQAQIYVPSLTSNAGDISGLLSTSIEKRSELIGSSLELYRKAFARIKAKAGDHHVDNPSVPCQCQQCWSKRRVANTPMGAVSSSDAIVPARSKRMADGSEKPLEFSGDMAMITPPSSPGPSPSRGRIDPFNLYPVKY